MLDDFMQRFSQELDVEELLTGATAGNYVIPLDEGLSINLQALAQGYSITSSIAPCPQVNREAFLTQVMLANLFGQGTHSAVLGLNEQGNLLTLSKVVDYTIDYKEFKDTLEDFINIVDFWREKALNHK